MTNKQKEIIKVIKNLFKDYKIQINVEEKRIVCYDCNNYWLGTFYLKSNRFGGSYTWFYKNLMKHFNNDNEMYEFIKPLIGKIIGKKINEIL